MVNDIILQIGTIEVAFYLIILLVFIVWLITSMIRIIREYERVVVFRLGRLLGAKGPGVVFLIPFLDKPKIVDLRLITFDVPKQNIITKDNITVDVDAVVYFRVADAVNAILKVKEYTLATSLLAQTTLRDVIGQVEFDELLTKREDLNKRLQTILDETTESWGIKVTAVAIRDAAIPESMQRAIAKQAEAEREKRSRIITAEGELLAAQKMSEAAESYAKNPAAMRLRELQTWTEIAREKNVIVVTEGNIAQALTGVALSKQTKEKSG